MVDIIFEQTFHCFVFVLRFVARLQFPGRRCWYIGATAKREPTRRRWWWQRSLPISLPKPAVTFHIVVAPVGSADAFSFAII